MDDPTSPDRVPLDRPPVPRFSPLPDFPELPELPRGSAIAPTPSIPIPAPPLPAPRVMVDLPRPSPTVSLDPPKPRPLPTPTPPPKPTVAPPVPTPVVASTPAPKGRWVGEALASLVTPTKSKVTVLAAAGSLVAGAFALQLLVGTGGDTATTKPKTPEVAAVTKATKPTEKPPEAKTDESQTPVMPEAPEPSKVADAGTGVPGPLPGFGNSAGTATSTWPETVASPTPQYRATPIPKPSELTIRPPAMPAATNREVIPVSGETPPTPGVPGGLTIPDLGAPVVPATPAAAPPIPTPTPTPIPVPTTTPVAPAPIVVTTTPVAPGPTTSSPSAPTEGLKPLTLPTPPVEAGKPIDAPKPTESTVTPTQVEQNKPGLGFKFNPEPPALPAPKLPLPVTPTPVPAPAFGIVEPPPQPKPFVPTPPASDVRTDYDVDLHPAQVGQTYEAVSKQHYADAKYADALRSYNKGRDPGRDEVQIPPVYVVRKLAAGTRAPAAAPNPIAPAGGETWARPAALDSARPTAAGRSYTVLQDGTTFRDLAGTLLSDRKLYRRISDLNPTFDSNAKLQKGDKITVP